MGGKLYRLDNSPYYAYAVSWQDIIEAEPEHDGFPVFRRVVEKSGHRTVRVIIGGDAELEQLKNGLGQLGCTFEGAWSKLISVDVPPAVELEEVRAFLVSGQFEWEHADPTYEDLYGAAG